jgi:hypothetical protein
VGSFGAGTAYYFDLDTCGSACTETFILSPSVAVGAFWGRAVAVSGDWVVVGSPTSNIGAGAVYVFELSACSSSPCTQSKIMTASGAASLGSSVSVDGSTAVAGAPLSFSNQGAAFIFDLDTCGSSCTQSQVFSADGGVSGDGFGTSIVINGTQILTGAPNANTFTGIAYVLDLDDCSSFTCKESEILSPSDSPSNALFGISVALDGDAAVVGAVVATASYVFDLANCVTSCNEEQILTATGGVTGDGFGRSVATSDERILIGAPTDDTDQGLAYLFVLPSVSVDPSSLSLDASGSGSYFLVLDAPPSSDVTVNISPSSADVTLDQSSVIFTSSNWNSPQLITVTAGSVTTDTTVTISNTAESADTNFNGLLIESVSVSITGTGGGGDNGGGGDDGGGGGGGALPSLVGAGCGLNANSQAFSFAEILIMFALALSLGGLRAFRPDKLQ